MPTTTISTGIDCCHEQHGDTADPTIVLVHGLGSQMLAWPPAFCELLVAEGYHVVRLDNRDSGLSTCLADGASYTLSDMAADAVALLDHLGVADAHFVGMSLGGMIVQTVAAEHPDRCRSMVSMASNTGNRDFGRPSGEALAAMMAEAPDDPVARTEKEVADNRIWCSPAWYDEDYIRALYADYTERAPQPRDAFERQWAAAVASGNRDDQIATITVPTRVLHGSADTLIDVGAGEHTAAMIPGADLIVLEGWGHDLPPGSWPHLVAAITEHTHGADGAPAG
ncbi:MAG: alpha/beta hydrolase [Actinobacteria bacterium]|nr:alpha/beta hydrolase [Actinomycetota bacterium]